MIRFRQFFLTIVIAAFVVQGARGQDDRNFSGRWVLNPNSSDVSGLPKAPGGLIVIEQNSSSIKLSSMPQSGVGQVEESAFNTNGTENRRQAGQTIISSRTKWEGAALLTSTNFSSPVDSYAVMDHWKLSRDLNRLTIEREIVGKNGRSEGTLVYDRERSGAAAPPTAAPLAPETRPALQPRPVLQPSPVLPQPGPASETAPPPAAVPDFVVKAGTRLPLRLINSVSTKHSAPGDKVYLETAYPVFAHGRVVIPTGSYVIASLTEVKRAGRVKGRSELFLRFDSITLPNGTTRDFRARVSQADAKVNSEGKIEGESGKGSDAKTVGTATAAGAGLGSIAGAAAGHIGMGAGIGAAAGALGGLAGVLATRGPDTVLPSGSTVEMSLDRDLTFSSSELPR